MKKWIIAGCIAAILGGCLAFFMSYTAFVDGIDFTRDEAGTYTPPSAALMRWEVFVTGTVMRSLYGGYIGGLGLRGHESVLDFGSGTGGEALHLAPILARGKGHLTCLDIHHSFLDVVRHRLREYRNVTYLRGDITNLALPAESYDAVVLRLVLHDIPRAARPAVVRELARVLKRGGTVYCNEPLGAGHAIDERELRSLFTEAGLTERYFRPGNRLTMFPPRAMGEGAYVKGATGDPKIRF